MFFELSRVKPPALARTSPNDFDRTCKHQANKIGRTRLKTYS